MPFIIFRNLLTYNLKISYQMKKILNLGQIEKDWQLEWKVKYSVL